MDTGISWQRFGLIGLTTVGVCLYAAKKFYVPHDEVFAQRLIGMFDNNHLDIEELNVVTKYTSLAADPLAVNKPPPSAVHLAGKRKRTAKCINKFACALGHEGYYQFGERPESPANVLITRKWMRDRMDEVPDMRKADKAVAIDIAVRLSFYPSTAALAMRGVKETNTHKERLGLPIMRTWWEWLMDINHGGGIMPFTM
jgi:hypothetical protein